MGGAFASADPHADDELPDSEPAYMVVGGQFGLTNASIKSFGLASFQELAVIGLATVGDLRANGISSDSDLLRFVRLPRSQALLGEHRRPLPPRAPLFPFLKPRLIPIRRKPASERSERQRASASVSERASASKRSEARARKDKVAPP